MVNLFPRLIFCSNCSGLKQVAKKEQLKYKKSNQKNAEKIIIQYENIYCDRAKLKELVQQLTHLPILKIIEIFIMSWLF